MSVFNEDIIRRAMEPNESPVVDEIVVGADPGFDGCLVFTLHADGSLTLIADTIREKPAAKP